MIETQRKSNETFHGQVLEKLADMTARKQEAARSTRHGDDFEVAVFGQVYDRSQRAGDVATKTGSSAGRIKNCKKGDAIVELGPERAAAGAPIVVEAKEDASYSLQRALEEIREARKNRDAGVGLFIFSAISAPDGLAPFGRYGDDVVIVWDADDPRSDVILDSGLSLAHALCARARTRREADEADFDAIDRAILEIEKQMRGLDEMTRSAETIKSGSEKILKRAEIMRKGIGEQLEILDKKVRDPKGLLEELDGNSTFPNRS